MFVWGGSRENIHFFSCLGNRFHTTSHLESSLLRAPRNLHLHHRTYRSALPRRRDTQASNRKDLQRVPAASSHQIIHSRSLTPPPDKQSSQSTVSAMPAMPESPSMAAERAMLQSVSRQCSELHHTLDDNEGLETGVNLMFGVISRCRKISQDHAENLSVPDKLELDEHCQDAMQVVGKMAQKAFAPRGKSPTKDMDMRAMRYAPGILTLPITTSALALRMRAIHQNMCELWCLEANASTVMSTASKVLRLCSGAEFTLHCSNGQVLKLDAVYFADMRARQTKKELFDMVVLTLMCLARSHSVWFNATIPTTEPRRAVMLWNIKVPGTGSEVLAGASGRRNCKSSRVIDNKEMSTQQAVYIQSLRKTLTLLRSRSPNSRPFHSERYLPTKTPSVPHVMPLPERADRVIAFVESVIRGRVLERDSLDKTYSDSLFDCGEEALTHLFAAAMSFFGISELPSATTPSVFRPSLSERPRPIPSDTDGLRTW